MPASAECRPCSWTPKGSGRANDFSELLIVGVLRGPAADDLVILATSEDDWTRWAMEFEAPSAGIAAGPPTLRE